MTRLVAIGEASQRWGDYDDAAGDSQRFTDYIAGPSQRRTTAHARISREEKCGPGGGRRFKNATVPIRARLLGLLPI